MKVVSFIDPPQQVVGVQKLFDEFNLPARSSARSRPKRRDPMDETCRRGRLKIEVGRFNPRPSIPGDQRPVRHLRRPRD